MDFAAPVPQSLPPNLTGHGFPEVVDALIELTRRCETLAADGCLSPERIIWANGELSVVSGVLQAEFAPPELGRGRLSSAADVYSIARILDWAAHRDPETAPRVLSPIVAAATESDPARRPTLEILRAELLALRGTLPPDHSNTGQSSTLRPPARGPTERIASGVRRKAVR